MEFRQTINDVEGAITRDAHIIIVSIMRRICVAHAIIGRAVLRRLGYVSIETKNITLMGNA